MRLEKIYRRKSGIRIKVSVTFNTVFRMDKFKYVVFVTACEKGKRTWRPAKTEQEQATDAEIQAAKLELWELMRPT